MPAASALIAVLLGAWLAAPAWADAPADNPFANLGVTVDAFEKESSFFSGEIRQLIASGCFRDGNVASLYRQIEQFEGGVHGAVAGNVRAVQSGVAMPYLGEGESCQAFRQVEEGTNRNVSLVRTQLVPLQASADQQRKVTQAIDSIRAIPVHSVRCAMMVSRLAARIGNSSDRLLAGIGDIGKAYHAKIAQLEGYRAQVAGRFRNCGSEAPAAVANGKAGQGSVANVPAGTERSPASTLTGVEQQKAKDEKSREAISK